MEKESGVTYVPPSDYASSTSSDGPYVPTTQVIGSKSRRPLFTTKTKGNGLGLWISREIIRRHGGELTLRETSEKGTVFEMRLPREAPADW